MKKLDEIRKKKGKEEERKGKRGRKGDGMKKSDN